MSDNTQNGNAPVPEHTLTKLTDLEPKRRSWLPLRFPALAVFLLNAIALAPRSIAQVPSSAAPVPRGVYIYSWDVANGTPPPPVGCTSSCTPAQQLVNALAVNGVDGLTLVLDWSLIEPGPGVYIWETQPNPNVLDVWIGYVANLGKGVNLAIRGGLGASGGATPSWLFQNANATPLKFDVSAHQGQGDCVSGSMAAPWDENFLSQWQQMLDRLATHLRTTKVGTATEMDVVQMIRLTGINRTTDEFRLPEQQPSTLATCGQNPINAIQKWLYPPSPVSSYRPALLQFAWRSMVDAFSAAFPGKYVNLPVIPNNTGGEASGQPQNPFPEVDDVGFVYNPPVNPSGITPLPFYTDPNFQNVDQNAPLLSYASQAFSNRLTIEFESLDNASPANPYVVNMAETLNAGAAFMTNNWLPGRPEGGAACSGKPGTGSPCPTAADYLNLIERGIYLPTPASSPNFRAQYLEVFYTDVLRTPTSGPSGPPFAFACSIWQAHVDLTDYTPPTTAAIWSLYGDGFTINFQATDNSTAGQPAGCKPLSITTEYQVDNASWQTGNSVSIISPGIHTVRYYSTDAAGNVEPTQWFTVPVGGK